MVGRRPTAEMSDMQDIPPGFYTWTGPVGVAALIVIIVMAVKGWTSDRATRLKKRPQQKRRRY